MAKLVFAAGTSHSPMLNAQREDWPKYEERDALLPLRDKNGQPASYAELKAGAPSGLADLLNDQALGVAWDRSQQGIAKLAAAVAEQSLDCLIMVGDDQNEAYHDDNQPAFLVYCGETVANGATPRSHGNRPEWQERASARYCEDGAPRDYPARADLAKRLVKELVSCEFDVSYASRMPEGETEGHAFGFIHRRIMGSEPIPVIPVAINTFYPPNQPTPKRCYQLGQAIRRAVEKDPEDLRVGIIASGGLSHFIVDEELDDTIVKALRSKDADALATLPIHKLEGGSSEIRNWICMAGAAERLPLAWCDYTAAYRSRGGTGVGVAFAALYGQDC